MLQLLIRGVNGYWWKASAEEKIEKRTKILSCDNLLIILVNSLLIFILIKNYINYINYIRIFK